MTDRVEKLISDSLAGAKEPQTDELFKLAAVMEASLRHNIEITRPAMMQLINDIEPPHRAVIDGVSRPRQKEILEHFLRKALDNIYGSEKKT